LWFHFAVVTVPIVFLKHNKPNRCPPERYYQQLDALLPLRQEARRDLHSKRTPRGALFDPVLILAPRQLTGFATYQAK
jgi:hypothetical protein